MYRIFFVTLQYMGLPASSYLDKFGILPGERECRNCRLVLVEVDAGQAARVVPACINNHQSITISP